MHTAEAAAPQTTRRWWCAYPDGTVWPCEIVAVNLFAVTVRPLTPAPDAGTLRTEPRQHVYDSQFNRPTGADVAQP